MVKKPHFKKALVVLQAVFVTDLELPALPGHQVGVAGDNLVVLADGRGEILKIQLADFATDRKLELVAFIEIVAQIEAGAEEKQGPRVG